MEISEIEKKKIQKMNETKNEFVENISRMDKSVVRLMGEKRKKAQISHVKNERGGDPIDFTEIKRIW